MSSHNFNFQGGDILSKIGVSWFVSYMYFLKIDNTHLHWNNNLTKISILSRKSKFASSRKHHIIWLERICSMSSSKLNRNKIGLDGNIVLLLANKLLSLT